MSHAQCVRRCGLSALQAWAACSQEKQRHRAVVCRFSQRSAARRCSAALRVWREEAQRAGLQQACFEAFMHRSGAQCAV